MEKVKTAKSNQISSKVDLFRGAMRRLAATVNLITTEQNGQLHGMTATAVMSLTSDPASLLVCVNQSASMHDAIVEEHKLCVNLLCDGQEEISNVFSGKLQGEERFEVGHWLQGINDLPYLVDAQASIFCTVEKVIPYSTHSVFIVGVDDILIKDCIDPLIYADGGYRKLAEV